MYFDVKICQRFHGPWEGPPSEWWGQGLANSQLRSVTPSESIPTPVKLTWKCAAGATRMECTLFCLTGNFQSFCDLNNNISPTRQQRYSVLLNYFDDFTLDNGSMGFWNAWTYESQIPVEGGKQRGKRDDENEETTCRVDPMGVKLKKVHGLEHSFWLHYLFRFLTIHMRSVLSDHVFSLCLAELVWVGPFF